MDGVIRCYTNGSSKTDVEVDAASSPTEQLDHTASLAIVTTDMSPSDRGPSTTPTNSNDNVVDVVGSIQPTAMCNETVDTSPVNSSNEQAQSDIDEQTPTSSPRSSEVLERLYDSQSSDWSTLVESKTSPALTAAESSTDIEKVVMSDCECRSLESHLLQNGVEVPVTTLAQNTEPGHRLCNVPDGGSAIPPMLSHDEATSSSHTSIDGRSTVFINVPVNVVKSQSVSVSVNSSTSTECPSSGLFKTANSLAADGQVKEDTADKDDVDVSPKQEDAAESACHVPVVSLQCSSLFNRLSSYIPSPGPLTQMYGGKDAGQLTSRSVSQPPMSLSSSSVRNSLLLYSPLKVGGDVSEITAKISVARSCSRNGIVPHSTTNENVFRRRADSFRSSFRMPESRSTPWLAAGDRSMENLRSPNLVMGMTQSASVSCSLADGCSPVPSSSVDSSPSTTPLASRCSSLMSTDSSTLRASTLLPDNSRKLFTIFADYCAD